MSHDAEHPELTRLKAELGPAKYAKALALAMEFQEYRRHIRAGAPHVTYEAKLICQILEEEDTP
jgi:hypothetical protein